MSRSIKIILYSILAIFVINFLLDYVYRKEIDQIPPSLKGEWTNGYINMKIDSNKLRVYSENGSQKCNVYNVIKYYNGVILSNIFGNLNISIICDKKTTKEDQKGYSINAPKDYKKRYIFSNINKNEMLKVEETQYMSRGWSESEGVYVWDVGSFYKE